MSANPRAGEEPVFCERCRFPNASDTTECRNCRWPLDPGVIDAQTEIRRAGSTMARQPFPVADLCGPQLRVLDLANQIRRAAYWRFVRELAEKAYEATPHDARTRHAFIGRWWSERAAESEAAKAHAGDDPLERITPADVALSSINILNWSAHPDAHKRIHRLRFLAAADQSDPHAFFQYVAERAFLADVDAEIRLLVEDAERAPHETGPGQASWSSGGALP